MEHSVEIPFSSLDIRRKDIYLNMGQGHYVPDAEMSALVEDYISRIAKLCRPRFAYRLFPVESVENNEIVLSGMRFQCGDVITPSFAKASHCAVFVATSGAEFHEFLLEEAASGDIIREFVSNCIGSELAEATGRCAAESLAEECSALGMNIGNSYSPGYCGWNVSEQRLLFGLMPPDPCGIKLTDSCLMVPIKSVSGIIPVGTEVVKERYRCAYCTREDCYKKRRK